jgi:hypothetical protein
MFRGMKVILRLLSVDLKLATSIVWQAKSLYLIIIIIWLANLVLLSQIGSTELTVHDLIVRTVKYFAMTIVLLLGYEVWKFIRASKSSKELVKFWFFYRSLAWLSWLIDLMMVQLIIKYGFWIEMALVQLPYLLINIWIMIIYDKFYKSGHDLLYIDYLKALPSQEEKNRAEKLSAWILKKRWRIFVLGSTWFEPDIATLLLRKKHQTNMKEIMRYTLPLAIICTTFWSGVFYLGVLGWNYFGWFIE